jgi:hypothetical protein
MSEPDLQSYLDAERAEGQFAGSGVFGIDFERAMIQQSGYSLPQPGLWAIRVIQGLIRLGATAIAVNQARNSFNIHATLAEDLPWQNSLTDTFRSAEASDPRFPLQRGLLAGLGSGYHIEMHWRQNDQRSIMSLSSGHAFVRTCSRPLPTPSIAIHARPSKPGLLNRLFGKADFSREFQEVSKRTFLAPVPVTLDQRPCDFSSGFALHFYPALEFRGVRATSGPRLLLLPSTARGLERPALDGNSHYQPLGSGGYAFVLSLGWSGHKSQMSTAAWIRDGALVDEEPLFPEPSPLGLTLFLPADDLPTDLTGLALRDTPERETRLQEARLWATTSLKTHAPPLPALSAGESEKTAAQRLRAAVEERMRQALEACHYTKGETRNFQDAIEAHLVEREARRLQEERARKEREQRRVKNGWNELEQKQQESLARWGRFLSYTPPLDESVYGNHEPHQPKPLKVAKFFGEVYVQLPNRRL